MFVQGLGPLNHIEFKTSTSSKSRTLKEGSKNPLFPVSDTFEPSEAPERKDLLQQIRKKVKSGYYHSDSVLEDLGHGFAKIFNQLT